MLQLIVCVSCAFICGACNTPEPAHPYQDHTHFSNAFGRDKNYRLYLPTTYSRNDTAHYPVIYFFHGWGGRHKSDDNARLAYDSLQKLVDKHQVLLVMWDGNVDENEPRPYNVGSHSDVKYEVQMKDYFPELIHHIDSTYRTLADKQHRGIIGFSMGGFMSYFLAGKYPELINAAVAMTGSPEFFVGYPDRHTLYPLRYTFENLREVKLRFHNSTADELTYLNSEVKQGAGWDGSVLFDYWQFEGGHMVDLPRETIVFDKAMTFVAQSFKSPARRVNEWSHYDVYPAFQIYGYQVTSDITQPGLIYLRHVKPEGFGITTLKWLPDGPPVDSIKLRVITAPVYPANTPMHVVRLQTATRKITAESIQTDEQGRLELLADGRDYEYSIAPQKGMSKNATPDTNAEKILNAQSVTNEQTRDEGTGRNNANDNAITVGYKIINGHRFLKPGNNALRLILFARHSTRKPDDIRIKITTTDSTIRILKPESRISLGVSAPLHGARMLESEPVSIRVSMKAPNNAAPPFARLKIETSVAGTINSSELVLPVLFDVPAFDDIAIDDNRRINDSTEARGQGNGDGIVQAGERIVVYVSGHPLKLYSDNKNVVTAEEETFDIMVPAKWPDGFTLASIVKIADDCPGGADLEFLGNYETKEFMPIKRTVHWGRLRIPVSSMR